MPATDWFMLPLAAPLILAIIISFYTLSGQFDTHAHSLMSPDVDLNLPIGFFIRVSADHEEEGLDKAEHKDMSYFYSHVNS